MNILLVDDDKLFIRKTVEGIEWAEIGVRGIYSAYNMEMALQVLEVFPIDILITDMEMPNGNGLELLEIVSRKYQSMDTLVLSGYAHFSYAQKSMEYGVKRFLVKPVSNKELRELLEELISDRKRRNQYSKENTESLLGKSFMEIRSEDEIPYELEKMAWTYPGYLWFQEAELRISYEEKANVTDKKLLMRLLNSIITGFFDESTILLIRFYRVGDKKWRMYLAHDSKEKEVLEILGRIQKYLKEMLQLNSCFCLSRKGTLQEVSRGHEQFKKLCDGQLFFEQTVLMQEKLEKAVPGLLNEEKLGRLLQEGNVKSAREEIDHYLGELLKEQCAQSWIFQSLLECLDRITVAYLERHKLEFDKIFEKEKYQNLYENARNSLSAVEQFVDYIMENMEKTMETDSGKRQLVDKLRVYIEEHLGEELSRTQISNSVNFSGDYVARVFKMITGKTLSEYIMERRIEKAKEYLLETDMSVGNISYEVGFNNFSYFSKAFKEHTGSTPNEYRMKKTT